MPEGPEVWILSEAINKFYHSHKTVSYGKHLFIFTDAGGENWSFGLTGMVQINDNNQLVKLNTGWLHGEQVRFEKYEFEIQNLGVDWLTCKEEKLQSEVNRWIKCTRKLGGLMLDQTKISGIGVAWGSEILFRAGLRPDMRACDQNLSKLVDSMIYIREKIKKVYSEQVSEDNCKQFINEWYVNLYDIREMEIYKKGSKLEVLGRSWWV